VSSILKRLFSGSGREAQQRHLDHHQRGSISEIARGEGGRSSSPSPGALVPRACHTEDGARLLDEIAGALRDHVVLPEGGADALALFVAHAHAHDAARISPFLVIHSPVSACGKTTLLAALAALAPAPLPTSNITAAALYRILHQHKHTLLIDEGDTLPLERRDLRGILNCGHFRDAAVVVRADGAFSVWCPKVIALIGDIPETLRDRSIRIGLRRKLAKDNVALLDGPAVARLNALGERLARWVGANLQRLTAAAPALPPELVNRAADNWRAMLAIADLAGDGWPQRARRVAVTASAHDLAVGAVALLADIRAAFDASQTDRMATSELIALLSAMEERPWAEWSRGKPITAYQLAAMLRPWQIGPRTLRFGPATVKGYLLVDFVDAFSRYL
jgi:putative DNA primase/helicase